MLRAVLSSNGPTSLGDEEIERIALDLLLSELDFAERDAAYRNALADAQGKKVRRRHSRKSVLEMAVAEWVAARKSQLAEMIRVCGDLPPADAGDETLAEYVAKVLAWSKKHTK